MASGPRPVTAEGESWTCGGTSHILPAERAKASFSVDKLTHFLDGDEQKTRRRRFLLSEIEEFHPLWKHQLDRPELLSEQAHNFIRVHEKWTESWQPTREDIVVMMENAVFSGSVMNSLAFFMPTIEMHASDEQKRWWLSRILRFEMIGSYVQTELGHGSNVRGLQTTAEYDVKTGEFVLNTPNLTSMKWWPGGLAKAATHAVLYAQLIINGKEHGIHSFMLQLRDENHRPLSGIEMGDIGPKLGDNANDTGYLRLKDVRIPREFILSRFQHVTRDGQYVRSKQSEQNTKLHYATMLNTRTLMIKSSGGFLARAATIAARYSCVRLQGFVEPAQRGAPFRSPERQIIDYQMQQYRVLKQIAMSYAIKFTGRSMLGRISALDSGDNNSKLSNIEQLPEIAVMSAGLKALCTYYAAAGIEDCRKCCGGNGYLISGGIAPIAADYVWQVTAEGDWVVMALQTAQFLVKQVAAIAQSGRAPTSSLVKYLSPLAEHVCPKADDPLASFEPTKCAPQHAQSIKDFADPEYLLELFRYCALVTVGIAGREHMRQMKRLNNHFHAALNACALSLIRAVQTHCFLFMFENFIHETRAIEDSAVRAVMTRLLGFWACSFILDEPCWSGLLPLSQFSLIRESATNLMAQLRPDIVALVDAFDIPDQVLQSDLGRFDGNVYEALFESARRSVLNQLDPYIGYDNVLKPRLDREFLAQGNSVPVHSRL